MKLTFALLLCALSLNGHANDLSNLKVGTDLVKLTKLLNAYGAYPIDSHLLASAAVGFNLSTINSQASVDYYFNNVWTESFFVGAGFGLSNNNKLDTQAFIQAGYQFTFKGKYFLSPGLQLGSSNAFMPFLSTGVRL